VPPAATFAVRAPPSAAAAVALLLLPLGGDMLSFESFEPLDAERRSVCTRCEKEKKRKRGIAHGTETDLCRGQPSIDAVVLAFLKKGSRITLPSSEKKNFTR
jgi:hypothetical protein